MILVVTSMGTAFADGSLISVQTDNGNYDEGDTIVISGKINTLIGDTQVTLQLFQGGTLISIDQIKVAQDGNYSTTINAWGPLWQTQGEYIIKVVYGEDNIAETLFNYTPKSEILEIKSIPEPVTNFQNYGIFITSVPEEGSRSISINGTTSNQSPDVTIRVLYPDGDNVVAIDQITPNSDGTFSTEFNVSNWKQDGMYMIKVSQGTDLMFRDSIQVNIINGVIE